MNDERDFVISRRFNKYEIICCFVDIINVVVAVLIVVVVQDENVHTELFRVATN